MPRIVATVVASGKLIVLLARHEPTPLPVHPFMPSTRSNTAKRIAFVSFAAPLLRHATLDAAEQIHADLI